MSFFFKPIQARSAPSLHHRFLVAAGVSGAIAIIVLAVVANWLLNDTIARQGDARVSDAANRALIVVTAALGDRTREARVLAMSPSIVDAAREGTARSASLGIAGKEIRELEARFDDSRSLGVAPDTRAFLEELLPEIEAAEIFLTDANGYNAITTQRTSDFVQSDEGWWQNAWRDGLSTADAAFDSSAHQTTLSLASVVRSGGNKQGVVKLAFSAAPLMAALNSAAAGVRVDILDSTDHVLLSSDPEVVGRLMRGMPGLARAGLPTSIGEAVKEVAVTVSANGGRWRIVGHLPLVALAAPYRTAKYAVLGSALLLGTILALMLATLDGYLKRRIAVPARELAEAAEAVAAGDFSTQLRHNTEDDEIGRLSRAVGAMIVELRRLASAIAGSARETSAMSSEITAGSEEMAATAGEIANTASDLSSQATSMAETIASLANSATSLQQLAVQLDTGAHEGVDRNLALRTLALDNRAGLDAGSTSLDTLAAEVNSSAESIEALAAASEEIRSFVGLVRKLARQSKLLALNAAMEAARAGVHGQGFAVVASEVRRLASMSSEAAEQTEAIVKSVLKSIADSRASAERAVATAAEVRTATTAASASFSEIELAVAGSEAWTATISQASEATTALVAEVTERLQVLSGGTESFAAAMEQVAASSQEQSASTEEIAGAANALGSAAEKLSKLVAGMRVEVTSG